MLWELREELGVEMAGKLQKGGLWRGEGSVQRGTGVSPCAMGPVPLSQGPLKNQQYGAFLASCILQLFSLRPSLFIIYGKSQQSGGLPFHSTNDRDARLKVTQVVWQELVNSGLLLILQDPT